MRRSILIVTGLASGVATIAVAVPRGAEHEALIERYVKQMWTTPGNVSRAPEILDASFIRMGPTEETSAAGLEAFMAYNAATRERYPDIECRVNGHFELGGDHGIEWTCRGTDNVTDGHFETSGTSLYTISNGRITSERASWDILGHARETGVVPPLDRDQENIELAERLTRDLYVRGDMAAAYEILAEDFVFHVPAGGKLRGIEAVQARAAMFREAFPDLTFTTSEAIASGDTVASRWTFRGTHRGAFLGVEATDRPVTIEGISMVRIRDGKLTEAWGVWDTGSIMKQLGAGH